MLGFFAAFLIFCFDNTDLFSRIPMGISAGSTAFVIVVYVLYAWEYTNGTSQEWFSLTKTFFKDRSEKAWYRIFPRRSQLSVLEVKRDSNATPVDFAASPS